MISTVNREGVHCENRKGGCQKDTISRVQHSWVGSNSAVSIVEREAAGGGVSHLGKICWDFLIGRRVPGCFLPGQGLAIGGGVGGPFA